MLEHLLTLNPHDFIADAAVSPSAILSAKIQTANIFESYGMPSDAQIIAEAERSTAQSAFRSLTTNTTAEEKRKAVMSLDAPDSVKHLVGMLTAFDWEFVEQAQEIRGYTVAQIIEETKHVDARIRLKALEMLGKVTEVALFTERIEIKQTGLSDKELEEQIREKLRRFMGPEKVVEDAVVVEDASKF